jgi:AP-1-like factor
MSDYSQLYPQELYLSPDQQDLLLAALSSNNPFHESHNGSRQVRSEQHTPPGYDSSHSISATPSGNFDNTESHANAFGFAIGEGPFLDLNPDVDFEYPGLADLIGDLPGSGPCACDYVLSEKRKSMDGKTSAEKEIAKKSRESEAKRLGRKPLASEPITVYAVCSVHETLTDPQRRSARHKIAPLKELSASVKRSICEI